MDDKKPTPTELVQGPPPVLEKLPPEPPVVARLVIEIRSDGSRTIARGAIEDLEHGQGAAIDVEGASPLAVAWKLVKAITTTPALMRQARKAFLLGGRKKK